MDYNRHIKRSMDEALSDTPVVCILGPRQCGKSTLVRTYDPNRTFIDLDDLDWLKLAREDPQGFLDGLPEQVTIDEVQRVPELSLAIKRSVDANRKPGRFLLTGSANLLQNPRLADSLAGRMECIYLHPLTEAEKERAPGNFLEDWLNGRVGTDIVAGQGPAPSSLPGRLVAGGFPEAYKRSERRARSWQKQYIHSIIERDIHDLADVHDAQDVSRLLEHLSNQTAQLLNTTSIANALGHTRMTIDRYLSILQRLFLVRQVPAWHNNQCKRLGKTPKVHICDSGLGAALSGLRTKDWNAKRSRFGHLLESFAVQQLTAMADVSEDEHFFSHYRDKDKVEIDLIIETYGDVRGVEVKAAATTGKDDGKGLHRLANQIGDRFKGGIVLYDGHSIIPIDKEREIWAVPFNRLWQW